MWKEYKELTKDLSRNGPDKEISLAPVDDSDIYKWTVRCSLLAAAGAREAGRLARDVKRRAGAGGMGIVVVWCGVVWCGGGIELGLNAAQAAA